MAIKVIKHGKKETTKIIYTINCPSCGCEFECEIEDFFALERTPDGKKFIQCPDWGEEITVDSKTKYREEKVTKDYTPKAGVNLYQYGERVSYPSTAGTFDDYKGPRCPKCGSTHYRTSGVGITTCLGWTQVYKDGKLLIKNPNKTTMEAECCECGAKFHIVE